MSDPERDRRSVEVTPIVREIFERVLASQNEKGMLKYRVPLRTFNGRDALWDAIEEAVDHLQYAVQAWLERQVLDQEVRQLRVTNQTLLQQLLDKKTPSPNEYGLPLSDPQTLIHKGVIPSGYHASNLRPEEMTARLPDVGIVSTVPLRVERAALLPHEGETLRPLIHRYGVKPCHKPAMYLSRVIRRGEPPDPTILRVMPDMHVPLPAEPPLCGSCGRPIDPYTNTDVDWTEHFTPESVQTVRRPLRPVPSGDPAGSSDDETVPTNTEPYPSVWSPGAPAPADPYDPSLQAGYEEYNPDPPELPSPPHAPDTEMLDGLAELAHALYEQPRATSTTTSILPLHPGEEVSP